MIVGVIKPSLFTVKLLDILVLGAKVDVIVRFMLSVIVDQVAASRVLFKTQVPCT